jgi:hypothetical protein
VYYSTAPAAAAAVKSVIHVIGCATLKKKKSFEAPPSCQQQPKKVDAKPKNQKPQSYIATFLRACPINTKIYVCAFTRNRDSTCCPFYST